MEPPRQKTNGAESAALLNLHCGIVVGRFKGGGGAFSVAFKILASGMIQEKHLWLMFNGYG